MNEVEDAKTPLKAKLGALTKYTWVASILFSLIVFIFSISTGSGVDPVKSSKEAVWQMVWITVCLIFAAVPEVLSLSVTIALSLGMKTMVVENEVLVKTLKSVIITGSVNIICSDKTGILTTGETTCVEFKTSTKLFKVSGLGYNPEEGQITPTVESDPEARMFLAICEENNEADLRSGNPTERALLTLAKKSKVKNNFTVLRRYPFSSSRKMDSAIVRNPGNYFPAETLTLVKGHPDYVLDRVVSISNDGKVRDVTRADKDAIKADIDNYSSQGKRVLGLAYNTKSDPELKDVELEKDLVWIGMAALADPPRTDIPAAITKCHKAGMDVRMITGDYAKNAEATAKDIGLIPSESTSTDLLLDFSELHDLKDNQEKLEERILNAKVFACAQPEDKFTILSVLQSFGNTCAITGDGVDDAPALKQADIGVAMGIIGTDAAKAAASMVLMDDSFSSLVSAVEEGRHVYANIQKICYYYLSTNIAEVFVILFSLFIGLQSPLVPLQILWLDAMTDILPPLALATEGLEDMIMLQGPVSKTDPIIGKLMIVSIAVHTIVLTAVVLFTYIWSLAHFTGSWHAYALDKTGDWDTEALIDNDIPEKVQQAQTCVMFVIVFAELLRAYTSRSLIASLFSLGVFTNSFLLQKGVVLPIVLTLLIGVIPGVQDIFGMRPISGEAWGLVIGMSILPAVLDEILKAYFRYVGFGSERSTGVVVRREKVRTEELTVHIDV